MTLLSVVALAAALIAAPVQVTPADSAAPVAPAATQATPTAESPALAPAPLPQRNSGLPQRAPVARTMSAFWPVFAAFTVVWLGILAYALSFGRRSAKLAEELRRLEAEARTS